MLKISSPSIGVIEIGGIRFDEELFEFMAETAREGELFRFLRRSGNGTVTIEKICCDSLKMKPVKFLKELEIAVSPPPKCHHCLLHGRWRRNDEEDWEDKLVIQINVDGRFHGFFLSEEDLEKPIESLIMDLASLLKQPFPENTQTSRLAGTFTKD